MVIRVETLADRHSVSFLPLVSRPCFARSAFISVIVAFLVGLMMSDGAGFWTCGPNEGAVAVGSRSIALEVWLELLEEAPSEVCELEMRDAMRMRELYSPAYIAASRS
jgi:hypothetical protein